MPNRIIFLPYQLKLHDRYVVEIYEHFFDTPNDILNFTRRQQRLSTLLRVEREPYFRADAVLLIPKYLLSESGSHMKSSSRTWIFQGGIFVETRAKVNTLALGWIDNSWRSGDNVWICVSVVLGARAENWTRCDIEVKSSIRYAAKTGIWIKLLFIIIIYFKNCKVALIAIKPCAPRSET